METLDLDFKGSVDNDIFKYLLNAIRNKETEFEVIFTKGLIDKPLFIKILKECRLKYRGVYEKNILDITVETSNVRFTIEGISNIQKFCKGVAMKEIPMDFMEKKKYEDKTGKLETLYSKNYPFRINLKNEKILQREDELVQEKIDILPNLNKYMRYKKRFSFITPDNLFRIDITGVKSAEGIDFIQSKILDKKEEYEIEIEFIGTSYRDGDELSIDKFLELFYSNDKDEMEKFKLQLEKNNYGSSINSEIYSLDPKIEIKKEEIPGKSEYQEKDISQKIYPSIIKPEIDEPLTKINSEYWVISDREWLLPLLEQKTITLESVEIGNGDYKKAPENTEYYIFNISPSFKEEELTKELREIDSEKREIFKVPSSLISEKKNETIELSGVEYKGEAVKKWDFKEIDTGKVGEVKKKRENSIVIENILKVLDHHTTNILKLIENTENLITYTKKLEIIDVYSQLTNQKGNKKRLIGPQPISMSLNELNPENPHSIFYSYAVTEKADGIRAQLIIMNDKRGYLLTSLKDIYRDKIFPRIIDTGLEFSGLNGVWLLDGEYITEDKVGIKLKTLLYKIFDIYYAGDGASKYPEEAYKYPWINPTEGISRSQIVQDFMESSNIKCLRKSNNLLIDCKTYYYGPKKMTRTKKGKYRNLTLIGKECQRIFNLDKNDYGYRIDGLIFLPIFKPVQSLNETPMQNFGGGEGNYVGGSWNINYKWKPPEENSIDFKLKIIKDERKKNKITSLIMENKGVKRTVPCIQVKL